MVRVTLGSERYSDLPTVHFFVPYVVVAVAVVVVIVIVVVDENCSI